jgi:hypothetical protein
MRVLVENKGKADDQVLVRLANPVNHRVTEYTGVICRKIPYESEMYSVKLGNGQLIVSSGSMMYFS